MDQEDGVIILPDEQQHSSFYSHTTNGLKVSVVPAYEGAQPGQAENHHVWSYNIQIENLGDQTVQLLSRYWQIIDAIGRIHEVRGPGVIGKQPVIPPGGLFEYTSEAHLATTSGMMFGSYQMIDMETLERFEVKIPAFSLDSPYEERKLN